MLTSHLKPFGYPLINFKIFFSDLVHKLASNILKYCSYSTVGNTTECLVPDSDDLDLSDKILDS